MLAFGDAARNRPAQPLLLSRGRAGSARRRYSTRFMYLLISHLTVPTDDCAALERHFRERSHLVDSFPGFLYLQLLSPQGGVATHAFLTAWESRAAFSAYMRSREHA